MRPPLRFTRVWQGLHIANQSGVEFVPNLISAVGDMHNAMSLSALIAPSSTVPGSRNIVTNIWDWDVVASWDDGATWASWNATEKSPGACGEGGGGSAMGKSGKMVMWHHRTVKVAVLVGAVAGRLLGLISLHLKAWGCPPHSGEAAQRLRWHREAVAF